MDGEPVRAKEWSRTVRRLRSDMRARQDPGRVPGGLGRTAAMMRPAPTERSVRAGGHRELSADEMDLVAAILEARRPVTERTGPPAPHLPAMKIPGDGRNYGYRVARRTSIPPPCLDFPDTDY